MRKYNCRIFLFLTLPTFLILLFTPCKAVVSGVTIIDQTSPLQNILHVHIDLVNTEEETFNNATTTVILPKEKLFFLRIGNGSDGNVTVSADNQIVTWTTDTVSSSKRLHLYAFIHETDTFTLTADAVDDQGITHTYTSNTFTTHFPLMRNKVFVIQQDETLIATLTDLIVSTELPATPVVTMQIRPNGLFGTAMPTLLQDSPFIMTYIPSPDFRGYDSFEVIGFDENGDMDSSSIFIAVGTEEDPTTDYTTFLRQLYNPNPENKRPSTRDINITIDHGETRLIFLKDYSVNYFNAKQPLTYTIDTQNVNFANVTLINNDTVQYASTIPEGSDSTEVDTILYMVTDPDDNSVQATITVTTQEPPIG